MNEFNIREQAERVHKLNEKWWRDLETGEPLKRNFGELIMLTISELAEALEGDRKNLMDDKLSHRSMLEVELADTLIRILDIIGGMKIRVLGEDYYRIQFGANTAENLLILAKHLCQAYEYDVNASARAEQLDLVIGGIFQLGNLLGLDILGAYEEKLAYNSQRADHKIEARKASGGKKY